MLTLTLVIFMAGLVSTPAQAKNNDYWISGCGKGMGKKETRLNVSYKGKRIHISGYGKKSPTFMNRSKASKLKARSFKVSSKCKVGTCGREVSYSKFLKENGRKGTLELLIDVHIKNNKVVYIDYGC